MPTTIKTSNRSLFWRLPLDGESYALLDPKHHGAGAIGQAQIPDVSPVYGRNANGIFEQILAADSPPGDLRSIQITFNEYMDVIHPLIKRMEDQKVIYIQRLSFDCPPVSSRALWQQLEHMTLQITAGERGAGPNKDGSKALVESNVTLKATEFAHLIQTSLSKITTTETEDILSIAGLTDDNVCLPGYPGGDRILFFGADDNAAPGNLLYSLNGGGSVAAITTDPTPFTTNSGINFIILDFISGTQFRCWVSRETDAATKTEFAYQDFEWAGSTLTAASWNVITIAATSNADFVTAMVRIREETRMYFVSDGAIYLSTDNGESDPGTAIYAGDTTALTVGAVDPDGNVWFAGASNLIVRELAGNRGTFLARTGPSGGGAFHALAFANDGTMFAANGQKLYRSVNSAGSTAGWSELLDVGSNHIVVGIRCKNGVKETLEVVVDDTTPGAGDVRHSEDGGTTWTTVTALTNAGYNQAYFPQDINKIFMVGDDDGSTGIIHQLS